MQYSRATKLIRDNLDKMHVMADVLMKYETIDSKQIDEIMEGRKPSPPADWTDGPSDSPSDPEASSPGDESVGDPITH